MTREDIIEHMKVMGQNAARMDEVMMYVMTRKDCEVVMAAAELLEAFEPKKLDGDGCGGAWCPKCGAYITEYHPKYGNELDGPVEKHCGNCGQALIWEVDLGE